MSKAIVTGGAGFIGSHVVDKLIDEGFEVTVLDNLSTGNIANVNKKADVIVEDICDVSKLPEVDYVFHLAALARIQPSIDDPRESNNVNLFGTLNILEYCRRNKAKLIFSSSSSIYEGSNLPTTEDDEIEPKNPYSLQKWVAEQYIELYGELYDMDYTILRYFNVFGERQILEGAYAAVVGIFLKQLQEGKTLTITNDGEQRRDFTYVKDVANANFLATQWEREAYNIGTGNNISINELASIIKDEKEYIGPRQGEVRETEADNTKAITAGWKPTQTIEEWTRGQLRT